MGLATKSMAIAIVYKDGLVMTAVKVRKHE